MKKYFLSWSWRRNLHVPVLIALEIIVVILYAYYVRFDSPLAQVRQDSLSRMFIFVLVRRDGTPSTLSSTMSM